MWSGGAARKGVALHSRARMNSPAGLEASPQPAAKGAQQFLPLMAWPATCVLPPSTAAKPQREQAPSRGHGGHHAHARLGSCLAPARLTADLVAQRGCAGVVHIVRRLSAESSGHGLLSTKSKQSERPMGPAARRSKT